MCETQATSSSNITKTTLAFIIPSWKIHHNIYLVVQHQFGIKVEINPSSAKSFMFSFFLQTQIHSQVSTLKR